MRKNISIAAIGDRDSVMLFQAQGVEAFYPDNPRETERTIHRLAKGGCKVIYITEQAAEAAKDALERYKTEPFPAIIPIPSRIGTTGFGMRAIRENVEKAVGADILFGEER